MQYRLRMRTVLIVGAGIAGSTLAYWLARHGMQPTVVERAQEQRSSGSPVDVRGPAAAVVQRMGVLPRLQYNATRTTRMAVVDGQGRRLGSIPLQLGKGVAVELPRGDLAAALADAARDGAEFRYGDTVTALADDGAGVDVTFEQASPRRFDLVVGADGLHSRVRRLAFGADTAFVRHLGMYVSTVTLDAPVDDERTVLLHNAPGRAVAVHPATGRAIAAFMFRSPAQPGLDHHDVERHKELVVAAYAGMDWQVPALLERVRAVDDLYFDSVSRVRIDRWARGRTVLVGDAASCVTLFGEGSSGAIAGAATLADALAAQGADVATALRRYEDAHRKLVRPRQRGAAAASHFLVPATGAGIAARDLGVRLGRLVPVRGYTA